MLPTSRSFAIILEIYVSLLQCIVFMGVYIARIDIWVKKTCETSFLRILL
jgi:hypothetical protein